jgi:glutamate/tyrosine decarboxylase-like PLP-dependent enzyme
MGANREQYDGALDRAVTHTRSWLDSVQDRPVPPQATADEIVAKAPSGLPDKGLAAAAVVDELAALVEPGLMAIGSGRFFGWVMGGTLPSALGADWLVSAWDQNAGMRLATPGVVAIEEIAAQWLLDALGFAPDCAVGFVTGATAANATCLMAARDQALANAGWDARTQGLAGGPAIRVLVGEESHASVDLALRYAGLGTPTRLPVDDQGRLLVDGLRSALDSEPSGAPTIVCLQAGNLHSGAFDPFAEAIAIAHEHGAWVHVDGAFGLWAAAVPRLRPFVVGLDDADSWATDAHKTLNVPYDGGIAIVRDVAALTSSMGVRTSYLIRGEVADPLDRTLEMSRRARGVPVWAALRELGRSGLAALVDGLCVNARAIADQLAANDGVEILNDVVYTQVCASFGSDERTKKVTAAVLADGTAWMSGSRWRDRDVLRVSVSNWTTDADDINRSVDAVRRAMG